MIFLFKRARIHVCTATKKKKATPPNDLQPRRRGRGFQKAFIRRRKVEVVGKVGDERIPKSNGFRISRIKGGAESAINLAEHIPEPRAVGRCIAVDGDIEPGKNPQRRKGGRSTLFCKDKLSEHLEGKHFEGLLVVEERGVGRWKTPVECEPTGRGGVGRVVWVIPEMNIMKMYPGESYQTTYLKLERGRLYLADVFIVLVGSHSLGVVATL